MESYIWIKFECTAAVLALRILFLVFGKLDFCAETTGTLNIGQRLLDFAPSPRT